MCSGRESALIQKHSGTSSIMVENRGNERCHSASKVYQNVLGLMIELENLFTGEEKSF